MDNPYPCPQCRRAYRTPFCLRRHGARVHGWQAGADGRVVIPVQGHVAAGENPPAGGNRPAAPGGGGGYYRAHRGRILRDQKLARCQRRAILAVQQRRFLSLGNASAAIAQGLIPPPPPLQVPAVGDELARMLSEAYTLVPQHVNIDLDKPALIRVCDFTFYAYSFGLGP